MLFKVLDFIKARKMARLRIPTGNCASNIPTTRSQTSSSQVRRKVSQSVPVQPEPRPSTSRASVKKRRYRPGSKALKEIRRYQRGTGLLVPKMPFKRVIKEISQDLSRNATIQRFTAEAMECLQVAAEAMVIQLFEDSVLVMLNAKRMTLMVRDMQLVRRIRGDF